MVFNFWRRMNDACGLTENERRRRPVIEALEDRYLLAAFLVTNTNDSGSGSLRQAILDSNSNPGLNTIAFNIPATGELTIAPASPLPWVTNPVVIDGTTQPGYGNGTVIELNGSEAGADANGLVITAGGSTVQGMTINGFTSGEAILLGGGGGNVIRGNQLGTDVGGSRVVPNYIGVEMLNSADNLIGGVVANLISGNYEAGVYIAGSPATGNTVAGNLIGTDRGGHVAVGNDNEGVLLEAPDNTVGGTTVAARNMISGNSIFGVYLHGPDASGNVVEGNYIGTDVTGMAALGNGADGVVLDGGAHLNAIGGKKTGAGNLISGNLGFGIVFFDGTTANNRVQGNYIGTDRTGTTPLGNADDGIAITDASSNLIGGTRPAARNVISANGGSGVTLFGAATGDLVQGNYIGTDRTGTRPLGNRDDGVSLDAASDDTVGGDVAGAGNVIAANGSTGVSIKDGATGDVVQGNSIGADMTGTVILGNGGDGVAIDGSSDNSVIGNRILGSGFDGVDVSNGATDDTITAQNVIAYSGNNGVGVDSSSTGIVITSNSIFSSGGLGIDLNNDGVTLNHYPQLDNTANGGQNFPTLYLYYPRPGVVEVSWSLRSTPLTHFTIQVFANANRNRSGYGEGESLVYTLDATQVYTDSSGYAYSYFDLDGIPDGTFLTSTATGPTGTSEFGYDLQVDYSHHDHSDHGDTAITSHLKPFPGTATAVGTDVDPGTNGPLNVSTWAYDFRATGLLAGGFQEDWDLSARIKAPTNLSGGPLPLVVLLQDQDRAADPGDDPLADVLASNGYIVLSVNPLGVNGRPDAPRANVDAQAQLLLRHLDLWKHLSTGDGRVGSLPGKPAPFGTRFVGKVDLQRIGLAGDASDAEVMAKASLYNRSLGYGFGITAVFDPTPADIAGQPDLTALPAELPADDGSATADNNPSSVFNDQPFA